MKDQDSFPHGWTLITKTRLFMLYRKGQRYVRKVKRVSSTWPHKQYIHAYVHEGVTGLLAAIAKHENITGKELLSRYNVVKNDWAELNGLKEY